MIKNAIISGMTGAIILFLIFFAITIWWKPFNYMAVYVANSKTEVIDSLNCTHVEALQDLESKGLLLTPQEYTSQLSNYYNTLVAFLVGLFVLFTIGSIWSIRVSSKKEMEDMQDKITQELINRISISKPFYDGIINDLLGRIEDDIITKADKQQIDINIEDIKNDQEKIKDDLNLLFEELDSKSEIKS